MTEVILYGLVAKKFPSHHKFYNINKPSDCINAIDANFNGFKKFFTENAENNVHYELIVDDEAVENANQAVEKKDIKKIEIVPTICGSDPFITAFVVNLVIGLVVAGIQYLMTPIPEEEPQRAISTVRPSSFIFANDNNVTSQFTPVPLGYGALRVGSKVIESEFTAFDLGKPSSDTKSAGATVGAPAAGGGGY